MRFRDGRRSVVNEVGLFPSIFISYLFVINIDNQSCLILNTLSPEKEIELLNNYIKKDKSIKIVIYGENTNDEKIISKYKQLLNLGFNNIYLYIGGLFEWLLLQDIYGTENFPTTTIQLDHLKYRARSAFNYLLENGDID